MQTEQSHSNACTEMGVRLCNNRLFCRVDVYFVALSSSWTSDISNAASKALFNGAWLQHVTALLRFIRNHRKIIEATFGHFWLVVMANMFK